MDVKDKCKITRFWGVILEFTPFLYIFAVSNLNIVYEHSYIDLGQEYNMFLPNVLSKTLIIKYLIIYIKCKAR